MIRGALRLVPVSLFADRPRLHAGRRVAMTPGAAAFSHLHVSVRTCPHLLRASSLAHPESGVLLYRVARVLQRNRHIWIKRAA